MKLTQEAKDWAVLNGYSKSPHGPCWWRKLQRLTPSELQRKYEQEQKKVAAAKETAFSHIF